MLDEKKLSPLFWLAIIVLLLTLFGLTLGSMQGQSPTFDEGFYIARGWAFWRTGHLLTLGHPALMSLWDGWPLLLEPGLPDPTTLAGWGEGNPELVSEALLWDSGLNVGRALFLTRLPTVWLALLLGAVVWRWAKDLYGPYAASLALLLFAFSPNLIAHAGLATTDLGVAAFYVAAVYAWTRFLRRGSPRWLLIAGVLLGLALSAKFSALMLLPTFFVLLLMRLGRDKGFGLLVRGRRLGRWASGALALLAVGVMVLAVIGVVHGFNPGVVVREFQHFMTLAGTGHRAYLLGRFSETGWWYYHPLVFLFKTPLPVLILLAAALVTAAFFGLRPGESELLVTLGLYMAAAMVISLNVGYRYLLPILPLVHLFIGRLAARGVRYPRARLVVLPAFGVWAVVATLLTYPHYLAFFNLAVGGPDNGYRLLVDSNLDWGQDLPALAHYLEESAPGERVYLSYFGQADPTYYGINAVALPAWPPTPPNQERLDFYPLYPAPGVYAISASNLVGVQMEVPDTFGYFRQRAPVAQVGHSILIYRVPEPESGGPPPAWFSQCASPDPTLSDPAIANLTGLSGLRSVYFDGAHSLAFPDGPGWLLLPTDVPPIVDLGAPDFEGRNPDGTPRYHVWLITTPPAPPPSTIVEPAAPLPLPIAGHLELGGYQVTPETLAPGDTLTLTVWWRVREPPPPPVSLFAHLLRPDGTPADVGDALGLMAEFWQPGTVIIQQHTLTVPEDAAPGDYPLETGLYSLATGERFPIAQNGDRVVDRVLLRTVRVEEP
jgi:hypothetical protein